MQKQITKNQTKLNVRRLHERIGALVLIGATIISVVAISRDAREVLRGITVQPAMAIIQHNGKENETARHPVRLDSVLRATAISGN